MAIGPWQTLFEAGSAAGLSDSELLRRSADRDRPTSDLAFATLVERHGPMVLRVCRKATGNAHDAHDAFQSTFLVLAKKAPSIRNRDSVASFLHGVALRVSAASRASEARRKRHERIKAESLAATRSEPNDPVAILHEEIEHLPRHYREAVILCYLEGKTGDEAAALLKCPVGTIKSRLNWARNRLRDRLVKRGVATTVGASAIVASESVEAAGSLSESLMKETASLAMKFARGSAGEVPAATVAMARKVMVSMILSKAKLAVAAMVVAAAATGVVFATKAGGQSPGGDRKAAPKVEPVEIARTPPNDNAIREKLDKMVEIDLPANPTLDDLIRAIMTVSTEPGDNGIPIYIDPVALQESECNLKTPVPLDIKKAKLSRILGDALHSLKLSYVLKDGLLMISSREANLEERLDEINRKLDLLIQAHGKASK